jgi:glutathione-regulated potassium-efflux system ancillary protein KefF
MEAAYAVDGIHRRPITDYARPIEETALFCGLNWLEPLVVHGAQGIADTALAEQARRLRLRREAWRMEKVGADGTASAP